VSELFVLSPHSSKLHCGSGVDVSLEESLPFTQGRRNTEARF